jgi:sugar lactone lactonase YvrE
MTGGDEVGGFMKYVRGVVALLVLGTGVAAATETRRWVADSADEFLKGRGEGVAVTADGRLERATPWLPGAELEEPVVVVGGRLDGDSVIVGTGHPARLYRITGGGKELLADVPGEQVTALLVTEGGDVLVASVAPGVLFRWRRGRLEELARLGEGGIWDLAEFDGQVVVAAGTPATLYRLGDRGLERWLELPDGHARCLEATREKLLVGTSGKGLILGVDSSGRIALLADSPFTEISDLVAAPDGSVWATALVGEPPQSKKSESNNSNDDEEAVQTETVDLDLPKLNGGTATSELLRLTPEGALLREHRFSKQVAAALMWDGEGVLVGTGYEGEVWRFLPQGGTRLATLDALQVVGFAGGGTALVTQAPAQVLWQRPDDDQIARFRSEAMHFPRPARIGEYRMTPAGTVSRIRFRSGASDAPDDSWLPWTDWLPAERGLVPLPPAKSLQWEVDLAAGAAVERVEVALREVNLAPTIDAVRVFEPGVVYLAAPPPAGPVIEREHPDFTGIFTVIDERNPNKNAKSAKGKKYYRVGFRTVAWKAKDANEDPLRFELTVESDGGFDLPVRERLKGTQIAVDTTDLPDGEYRFRVIASDELENPGDSLTGERRSRWFTVDNTPPEITLARQGDRWQVTVTDALSSVARVEWSRNGERWYALAPADGVMDGVTEEFSFASATGRHLVVVRAIDRHHNRATAGGVEE